MKLKEFRKTYPQYNNVDDQKLADSLHSKFYSSMPKEDYYNKIGLQQGHGFLPKDTSSLDIIKSLGHKAVRRGVGETATLGFQDELIGGAKSLVKGTPYKEERDIEREKTKQIQEEFPKTFLSGKLIGGVPSGGAILKGAGKLGAKGLTKLGVAGIGEGAIYGLGQTKDIKDTKQTLADIKESSLYGGLAAVGLGVAAKGAGLTMKAIRPLIGKMTPKRTEARKLINTLKKEGTTPEVARQSLQKMQDEGVALIDVVDPRSSIISNIPERAYEKKTIDVIDNYTNQLNRAGNKAKAEVLDLVSKKKISATEGAELLGQNAQEVIKRQKKIRTAKAKPLYEKAKTGFINANDPILNVPVVKESIAQAKKESLKFGTEGIGNITGKPDNSIATLHQAKDYLYRKSKDFADVEQANYNKIYAELSNKLKKNPDYKKATDIWAGETEGLEKLYKQKGIGNIAKKYEKGDLDGIQSSVKNVFKKSITDEQVTRLKNSLPEEQFNAIVRKDLDTILGESGGEGSNLTKSLFGKREVEGSLKNKRLSLIFNPKQKRGLRKTTELLDKAIAKEKQLDKLKFRTKGQQLEYIQGGKYALVNTALKAGKMLTDSPQQREAFVNYLFTQEGKQLLEQIAKSNKRDAQNLIIQALPAILTQTQKEEQ